MPTRPSCSGVDFTVEDGEFVAFVGTNGAGKSTTMRLVNGLLKPESGQVLIDGVPTTQLKTSELAQRVGFLFQNPDSQICCSTVREELLFGFKTLHMDMDEAARRIDAVIDEFGFNPDDDPFLLNRGTRQLLALASIVVLETPVVVLDEPTTGLDFRECVKVMDIIRRLHERGHHRRHGVPRHGGRRRLRRARHRDERRSRSRPGPDVRGLAQPPHAESG